MPTVQIIADSTCDLGAALIARYDVAIAPLYVTLGETSYRDGIDITPEALFAHCEQTKETPKTSATSVGDFIDLFTPYAEAGRDIVFIAISAAMSSTVQNALLAAESFPGRVIRCVDGQNLSTGTGLLVIEAAERAQAGMGANQIADEIEALREKVSASFVIDTMAFLYRGGRCSGLQMLGAAMLNIKPEISVQKGKMSPTDKFRGNIRRVIRRYLEKQFHDLSGIDPRRIFITHAAWSDEAVAEVEKQVRELGYFEEILITRAGCVISSHCGPWTLGVLFLKK
ncbi:MAG: DegV family protein [Oscillospiraceae bacterium]|jgi:DegV family protein with EDD domain|nr:DegV family protein [Oscillospiraceae bacterium]